MNEASWIAVSLAVVALLKTVASDITARKAARDKMEFDARLQSLSTELDVTRAKNVECEERHDEIEGKLDECQQQHREADRRLSETDRRLRVVEDRLQP